MGENVLVTGGAGVGKSYVIKQIDNPNTVLCAPTGIAALNIGGATAHRTFGLPLGIPTQKEMNQISRTARSMFGRRSNINRIIIDECAMMRADTLDMIDHKLKLIRESKKPFGGLQVVGVGDFFQLAPIANGRESEQLNYMGYKSPYCFDSKCWNFDTIELTKVYRQEDERQQRILHSIRIGDKWQGAAIDTIQKEATPYSEDLNMLHLCAYNADADYVNDRRYREIVGEEYVFTGKHSGKNVSWKDCIVGEHVKLKVNTEVLICANCKEGTYVNGDRGKVLCIKPDVVTVELHNGDIVDVIKHKWDKHTYKGRAGLFSKQIESSFIQMPLKLGWAVSIHKSQGMTLDAAAIDVGRGCFSAGQMYVALSRVRDLRNLSFVRPISQRDVITSQYVKDFYDGL